MRGGFVRRYPVILFFLPAYSFSDFPFHEFNLQVGFVLVLFNLGDGGQQLRQVVVCRYGVAVVGSHGGGVGAFAKIVDADVFILVQVEESDYVAVFSYLVIRFFYFLSQVGGLIAVFGRRSFGKAAVRGGDLPCLMVDVVRAAFDGGHAHDAVLVHLKTQVRTVEVLFYHLRRMQVIAYPLVLGVFLEGIVAFNGVYGFLLFLQHAVEVGKRL